ncbi:uncharacterized protein LOC144798188 [Lissotriton helveticus]
MDTHLPPERPLGQPLGCWRHPATQTLLKSAPMLLKNQPTAAAPTPAPRALYCEKTALSSTGRAENREKPCSRKQQQAEAQEHTARHSGHLGLRSHRQTLGLPATCKRHKITPREIEASGMDCLPPARGTRSHRETAELPEPRSKQEETRGRGDRIENKPQYPPQQHQPQQHQPQQHQPQQNQPQQHQPQQYQPQQHQPQQYQPQQHQPQQYQPQQHQPQQYQPQQNQPQQYQGNEAGLPQSYQAAGTSGFQPVPYMAALPNIPPGLEYLAQVDQILIHQKRHRMFQSNNEFEILNAVSQKIFHAREEKECCGPRLDVRVYNNSQTRVLHILLPDHCCSWTEVLEVHSPTSGSLIGYITKNWGAFSISFSILNNAKEEVLRVVGPGFGRGGFKDVNFEVKTSNEAHTIGRITRVWRGFLKAMFSSNDHYSVQFPIDLDVKVKALLLSTGIFLDHLYYEERNKD